MVYFESILQDSANKKNVEGEDSNASISSDNDEDNDATTSALPVTEPATRQKRGSTAKTGTKANQSKPAEADQTISENSIPGAIADNDTSAIMRSNESAQKAATKATKAAKKAAEIAANKEARKAAAEAKLRLNEANIKAREEDQQRRLEEILEAKKLLVEKAQQAREEAEKRAEAKKNAREDEEKAREAKKKAREDEEKPRDDEENTKDDDDQPTILKPRAAKGVALANMQKIVNQVRQNAGEEGSDFSENAEEEGSDSSDDDGKAGSNKRKSTAEEINKRSKQRINEDGDHEEVYIYKPVAMTEEMLHFLQTAPVIGMIYDTV